MRSILLPMGFSEKDVDAAAKHCSSVEAAVDFIMNKGVGTGFRATAGGGAVAPVAAAALEGVTEAVDQLGALLGKWMPWSAAAATRSSAPAVAAEASVPPLADATAEPKGQEL